MPSSSGTSTFLFREDWLCSSRTTHRASSSCGVQLAFCRVEDDFTLAGAMFSNATLRMADSTWIMFGCAL